MSKADMLSWIVFAICLVPLGYWLLQAVASIRSAPRLKVSGRVPTNRFLIAIPAHDESPVIRKTVEQLAKLDYPSNLFSIHVVADHCSDNTAELAREAGAIVHELNESARTGKGAGLSWLLERIIGTDIDAIVVFDADTMVHTDFLRVMDVRLSEGEKVVQGQHIISNPRSGWFPALTWAMFMVDNRFQNLGRSNLGWSAKHMGDSICFRADVLRKFGWGEGLAEDHQLRQRLLLEGTKIAFEPAAQGYGEAPRTWMLARAQRARWIRGARDADQDYAWRLFVKGLRQGDLAMLDGALQGYLPAYSTVAVVCTAAVVVQIGINRVVGSTFSGGLLAAWLVLLGVLFLYPVMGLVLERAPLRAYLAILSGPAFIIWRTWVAVLSRVTGEPVVWVRTAREKGGRK